jgi:hypothetical protein
VVEGGLRWKCSHRRFRNIGVDVELEPDVGASDRGPLMSAAPTLAFTSSGWTAYVSRWRVTLAEPSAIGLLSTALMYRSSVKPVGT